MKKQNNKTTPKISRLPVTQNKTSHPKFSRKSFTFNAAKHTIHLGIQTKIMGVVNITPDSFSGDGCLKGQTSPLSYAKKLIRRGAHILDIGGESSRPGAKPVSANEETQRIIPTINALAKKHADTPISVDTYKPEVAQQALDAGASMINTIKGCEPNPKLLKFVREYNAGICLMHMQGTPQTMQKNIHYTDVIDQIMTSLKRSIEICLENGIRSDRIMVDPGIGFGKTLEHNLIILNRLSTFARLAKPLVIGTSRKSFIGKVLDKDSNQRLYGSLSSNAAAIFNGAHILRVHDVKQHIEIAKICDAIRNEKII